jgi:mannose-6-phosphate isomerase-like protein (cupin superfamily)
MREVHEARGAVHDHEKAEPTLTTRVRAARSHEMETLSESPAFGPLVPISLKREAQGIEPYKNFVLNGVNDHCIRMAVMAGEYPWHYHPRSDETFLVLEGQLEIDLTDNRTVALQAGEMFTIPAGVRHRTRAVQRTVNLCFENTGAYTDVVFV